MGVYKDPAPPRPVFLSDSEADGVQTQEGVSKVTLLGQ